jgi:hypothetical protein
VTGKVMIIGEIVVPLSETEAKRLDKKIRLIFGNISDELDKLAALIAEAKTGSIHVVLGHKSWTAYLASVAEIGWKDRDDRRKIVALLSGEGMSQRTIGAVVGVSQKTVDRDLDEVSHDDSVDAEVISLDGKRRPKHPNPKPKLPEGLGRSNQKHQVHALETVARQLSSTADVLEALFEKGFQKTCTPDFRAQQVQEIRQAWTRINKVLLTVIRPTTDDA